MNEPPLLLSPPCSARAGLSLFVGWGSKRIFVHSSCFETKRNFPAHFMNEAQLVPHVPRRSLYISEEWMRGWCTEITRQFPEPKTLIWAFSVLILTIDKVKVQKWPILLIPLPGRYWVLRLSLFVTRHWEAAPRQAAPDSPWQPLATTWPLLDSWAWENVRVGLFMRPGTENYSVNG